MYTRYVCVLERCVGLDLLLKLFPVIRSTTDT